MAQKPLISSPKGRHSAEKEREPAIRYEQDQPSVALPEAGAKRPAFRRYSRPIAALMALAGIVLLLVTFRSGRGGDDISSPSSFFDEDFAVSEEGEFGLQNLEVLRDARFGEVLRVHYPEGSASPTVSKEEDAPVGGAQMYMEPHVGVPADRLHLRYYVRFAEDFDFVKGGKLPGLYGGSVTGGRRTPDGTDGFSTRFMWRRDGVGEVYAYLATSEEEGTSLGRGSWEFQPGTWHLIEQEVSLNEPGKRNGRIRVWLDEREVLNQSDLEFRTTDSLKIEGVFFSTFFGGSDSSWATPRDTTVDFAALEVGSDYLGPVRTR